jgi:hypothetical protein
MKELEVLPTATSILPCYDVEETAPEQACPAPEGAESGTHMRAMRTICLRDCAIPE